MLRALRNDPRWVNWVNWFYGFTPPERGKIHLGHRRVYIVPTRIGWMFGATLAILLLGSINYAIALGFALTFLLAGLGLVGMVHTARNLARLSVSSARAEPVFAGEAAQFRLLLENPSRFDRPSILVRHVGSEAQVVVDVGADSVVEAVLAIPAARRGRLAIGRVMLETRFPLDLFRAWSYVEPDAHCLVYPRPFFSALPDAGAQAGSGKSRSHAAGNDDFAGLRTYHASDSPRHIAWKTVARTDNLLTKQFSEDAAEELWLDWERLNPTLGIEDRLSMLAGWVLAAEKIGSRYALRIPGTEIESARGDAHRNECLQALALYQAP